MNKGIYLKTADIYLRFPEIMEEECNDLAEFLEDEHIVYEGATDIVYNLQQENQRLKEIEKEHQRINGELRVENKELKDRIKTYEEPEDLTLMFMYCDEKVKDKMKELKKQLTTYQILHRDCKVENLKNISKIEEMENQQKEFIKYMNDISEDLETEDVDDEEMKGYLIQRIDTFKEILSKYKKIIGGKE